MWLLAVDLKGDFTDDMPQLPDRLPKVREAQ
jgi:hypothetical protein